MIPSRSPEPSNKRATNLQKTCRIRHVKRNTEKDNIFISTAKVDIIFETTKLEGDIRSPISLFFRKTLSAGFYLFR